MFTAKERVLLDEDGNCVSADDPSGVQVLAGFKGVVISEKQLRNVKGHKKFFTHPHDKQEEAHTPTKRVVEEAAPIHTKPPIIKKSH